MDVPKKKKKTTKKLNLEEEEEDLEIPRKQENNKPGKKKKKALVSMDLYALPPDPVELQCPMCGHEGPTLTKKSWSDRGKVLLFWIIVTVFVCLFFVFILAFIVLQMIICNKNKGGRCGGECCTCRSICSKFTRFQPKVNIAHCCAACKKQIGMAK